MNETGSYLPARALEAGLAAVAPSLDEATRAVWHDALAPGLGVAGLTTPRRLAAFLAQCAVESGGFVRLEENLDLDTDEIWIRWPALFGSREAARDFGRQPMRLARYVYADRDGNADEASCDGWRYRGRGLILIRGRMAYDQLARDLGHAIDPDWIATPQGAAAAALWQWHRGGIARATPRAVGQFNRYADAWDIDRVTLLAGGSLRTARDRRTLADRALVAIYAEDFVEHVAHPPTDA